MTYDLPPEVIGAVEGRAGGEGVPVDEFVGERLLATSVYATVRERVGQAVAEGMCDADIAGMMHYPPGRIATIRRSLGLAANKRYRRGG